MTRMKRLEKIKELEGNMRIQQEAIGKAPTPYACLIHKLAWEKYFEEWRLLMVKEHRGTKKA